MTCFADEPWLPRLLGGRGETKACWTNYPFQEPGKTWEIPMMEPIRLEEDQP